MTILFIDFETRSPVDLKKAGLHNYATDPRTEVLCMARAFDDADIVIEWPTGAPTCVLTPRVEIHVLNGGIVVAHNAAFELAIWNHIMVPRYGWPPLKPEQVHDTMAMAYAMSLPGSLENAAAAVGIEVGKDKAGHRLMLAMCKPQNVADVLCGFEPEYREDAESLRRLYDYCKQDVEVERELYKRLRPLSPSEHALWVLDHNINQRGIYVDKESIAASIKIVEGEQKRLDAAMRKVTGNSVASCTAVSQLLDWIRWQGVPLPGVAKADVLESLGGDLPDAVRSALKLRQEAGKSSTAKLRAMVESASSDSRIRGTMQYHGAGTGRWAGRRIQPHNMPRGSLKPAEVEDALALLRAGKRDEIELVYGPVLDVISSCLRGMITASPGHELVCCDFSAIEARVLAWLAGQEDVLEIFRGHGKIYEHAAAGIYGKPMEEVTKDERQIGKVAVLALGYGGGVGAFQTMARAYNVSVSDERADEIKAAWRTSHKKIVAYWYALEEAAIGAVRYPGDTFGAGHQPVRFRMKGSFLWCQLPSGRLLCYPYARIDDKITITNGKRKVSVSRREFERKSLADGWHVSRVDSDCLFYMSVDGLSKKWAQTDTYSGKICENIVQGVARDLLAEALVRLDAADFPVSLHCHDEAVAEVPTGAGRLDEMLRVVSENPPWAKGLPLSAEGWVARRYKK